MTANESSVPKNYGIQEPTLCDPNDRQGQAFGDHDDYRELKFHDRVPVWEGGRKLDPEYGFFCDNVREEEKGFVLEIAAEDEAMPLTIRYEVSARDGLVAKTPKAVRIGTEKMEQFPCSTGRNNLDCDARDECVSEGNGLARDTCFSYGDGLAGDCEMHDREGSQDLDPSYKFFLEKLKEGVKGYKLDIAVGEEAVPRAISCEISSSRLSSGFAAKTPKVAVIGSEKMGSHDVEVPCSFERNSLDVIKENNARLDIDVDAKDTCFNGDDSLTGDFELLVNGWEGSRKLDPSYKFFLENLKEEAKGYKLEIAVGEEAVPLVISYKMSASGVSSGFVAKTPKASLLGTEKMGSHDVEVPCRSGRNSLDIMEQKNTTFDYDGDAEDTISCAARAIGYCDGVEVETPEVARNGTGYTGSHHEEVPCSCRINNLELMDKRNARLDNAEDTRIADSDALTDNCEILGNNMYFDGIVAETETQNIVSNEAQEMGCHLEEVTLSIERVDSEIMEESNAGIDHEGDAESKCDERHSSEVMKEDTWLDQVSDDKYNCTEEESLEAIENKARLDNAEDTCIADGDGLALNCEVLPNNRNLDEIVAETEIQNAVSNETQDMGCHRTERVGTEVMEENNDGIDHDGDAGAKYDERHSSEVTEENTWLDQIGDAKYNCTEGECFEAIENKARLDDDGDSEDTRIADGDGLAVNCDILANNRYLDGIVAETDIQNVVSNETQDMGCHHEEVILSTDRVGLEVMEENNDGIDHHGDAETKCDERHGSEVMEEKNTWLDQCGDAKYDCTEGESLFSVENMNARSVGDGAGAGDNCVSGCYHTTEVNFGFDFNSNTEGNCVSNSNDQTRNNCVSDGDGGVEVNFVSDGIFDWNSDAKGNYVSDCNVEEKDNCVYHSNGYGEAKDNYVSDGIVAESETQNVVSNETQDMVYHHEEVTLITERVSSEVMEKSNDGIDHDGDAEANCDERHSSEVMEGKNTWLDQVCDAKYNCIEGESLEAIENMNARSVGDGYNCVSDCDIEVNFGSDFNGIAEGSCVSDSNDRTKNNCASDGDRGIVVNFVSDGNGNAKGDYVSDSNDKEKDNSVFHSNGYDDAEDNSESDDVDVDANGNCALDCNADCEDNCVPDCEPKGKGSSEVNGVSSEHCVSDGDKAKYPCDSDGDDVKYHCVSDDVNGHCVSDGDDVNERCVLDGDDVNEYCASDEDAVNEHCVSDSDDVNEHCASSDDDIRYLSVSDFDADDVDYFYLSDGDDAIDSCVSISSTSKYGLDSDATVDECYKLFLHHLKPDGETADFPIHNGKRKKDDQNGGADSDEEEKPKIDGLNCPFPSFSRRSNSGHRAAFARAKLSKYTDKLKFREELMSALRKPYDRNEYEKLWDKISMRAPVKHRRVLRGKTKMYSTDNVGKSYLDHYPDLASLIKSVEKDQPRVLNLLRGFFYWLENLSCQGVFFPWKDSACLEILPET